jgi:hypothetical protein
VKEKIRDPREEREDEEMAAVDSDEWRTASSRSAVSFGEG